MTNTHADNADSIAAVKQTYDVFNGDADGICALHQLRLANPRDAILVTGAKRDISLLERVPVGQAGEVNVFDISLDTNVAALKRLLDDGCQVNYFDHHAAQQAFTHPRLNLFWDESPEVCTSVLVDLHLQGRFRPWAVTAAFGDNLEQVGRRLATDLGMPDSQAQALQLLGTVLNYNAYGESVADLYIAPDLLYRALHPFVNPLEFIANAREYKILHEGYQGDAERMAGLQPLRSESCGAIYLLPNAPWARRISGVFANQLAAGADGRSFAVLTEQSNGCYGVSVRSGAPMTNPAHRFCETFETGGGRKVAAGVNQLPATEIERFSSQFFTYFGSPKAEFSS
ncbi:MAG TPA: hypothetical protein VK832_03260 [Burkholderiaceae bacterium]|jgi:hypothetical protein|nr:hypothetical protein [Burkholderiaceae bacterium]